MLSGCISVSEGLVGTYCAFSPVSSAEMFFFFLSASIFTVVLSHLICIVCCFVQKMKSETQNIYNFCMEKKKEC